MYLQMNRSGAAYAMGSALYSENFALFIRLWNEGIALLPDYYPDQMPVYPDNIAAVINDNNIPLSIAADGTLSIVV